MNEIIEHWKKRLIEINEKIKKLEAELEEKQNIKSKSKFEDLELNERIYYLKDWIDFNQKEKSKFEAKLKSAEQIDKAKEIAALEKGSAAFKLIFAQVEEEKKAEIFEIKAKEKPAIKVEEVKEQIKELFEQKEEIKKPIFKKVIENKAIRFGVPILLFVLIISILFISKPEISGYVVLTQEKAYDDNLNLAINESSEYIWKLKNPGKLKSIKATGSIFGNGTVKIYIEKGGERYLIYQNK